MKKALMLLAVTTFLCGLALAVPNGNGATKVDLCVSDAGTPVKPVVGWVVFNVNAEGVVIAEVHIDDGDEGTYDVKLNRGTDGNYDANVKLDKVTVNKAGKGNAHLAGDLAESTQVRVNVLPEGVGGQANQIFTTGWIDM